ncbi:MAG TPA: fructosamine kinase family protein [Gammaproteobacteria bacterium]|nr:fructosamine kinase family protein [Gammaproteobacteria bacterium]
MTDWTQITEHISACIHENFALQRADSLSGGCINEAWCLIDDKRRFFVKLNSNNRQTAMFSAEFAGLLVLYESGAIRVPKPLCYGATGNASYLVTEYLPLTAHINQRILGRQLAELHRHCSTHYGWERDNTLGTTLQQNTWSSDWSAFWREHRLGYQLQLAARNGYGGILQKRGEQLLSVLDQFLSHRPQASLLHGDLWSGNIAGLPDGTPVIFDPAVYHGDRECDLAMTELFGGFGRDFYAAYREQWPADEGYRLRKDLYNLYHVLNHLNLFGGGYLRQSQHLIDQLLAEVH